MSCHPTGSPRTHCSTAARLNRLQTGLRAPPCRHVACLAGHLRSCSPLAPTRQPLHAHDTSRQSAGRQQPNRHGRVRSSSLSTVSFALLSSHEPFTSYSPWVFFLSDSQQITDSLLTGCTRTGPRRSSSRAQNLQMPSPRWLPLLPRARLLSVDPRTETERETETERSQKTHCRPCEILE